ncbi:MAG: lanthionine synthetase LanC family protein [Holophagaceae bacterium]
MIASANTKIYLERELFDVIVPSIDEMRDGDDGFVCHSTTDIGIFDFAMYQLTGSSNNLKLAQERIIRGIEKIIQEPFRLRSIGGHIGSILLADIIDPNIVDEATQRTFFEITTAHINKSSKYLLEFMHGLAGVGLSAQRFVAIQAAQDCIESIVAKIIKQAKWDSDGCYWVTSDSSMEVEWVRLGYAHGNYGIIDFLATEYLRGNEEPAIYRTLDGACKWMTKRLSGNALEETPVLAIKKAGHSEWEINGHEGKLIWWCLGPIGLIIPLIKARSALGDETFSPLIRSLILNAAPDISRASCVCASGMCHGYMGNINILMKAYKISGDDSCLQVAKQWQDRFIERILSFGPQSAMSRESLKYKYNWDRHLVDRSAAFERQMIGWHPNEYRLAGYMMGLSGIGASIAMLIADRCDQWGLEGIMIQ